MQRPKVFWPSAARVEALTDGIFAIAMTIMVLDLQVPEVSSGQRGPDFSELLSQVWPQLLDYATSFLLLAIFWIIHHKQFRWIKRTDQGLIWINTFILLLVALVPYSTSLEHRYGATQAAAVFFEVNLLLIGCLFALLWLYATRKFHLVDSAELDAAAIKRGLRRNLVAPVVALLAIALSFISPDYSPLAFLLIPVILVRL